MRPRRPPPRRPVVRLLAMLLTALALAPLQMGELAPAQAAPLAPRVSPGGAFASAVPCLTGADTFVTALTADTLFFPAGAYTNQDGALGLPAVQTLTQGGAGPALATLRDLGATYGLAYDDGRASGRERIFAAAFTKRMVAYGPAGAGGIYVFQRVGGDWSLLGSFSVPGATGASHVPNSSDLGVAPLVGKTGLGDLEISPDGRSLYVVNIGPKRLERYDLAGGAIPTHAASIAIDLGKISASSAVQADLYPFALEFFPNPYKDTDALLMVGVTDSAERGAGQPPEVYADNQDRFAVSPQAHILTFSTASRAWWLELSKDLGNDSVLAQRHGTSTFGYFSDWNRVRGNYLVKGWNPWRALPSSMANKDQIVTYPQPWLTDIEFLAEQPAPPQGGWNTSWDIPTMVLGLRDRTGDQVFNASLVDYSVPPGELTTTAQGDTMRFTRGAGGWVFQSGEAFDDDSHLPVGSTAHFENHSGALASILNDQTTATATGETMATTSLGGVSAHQARLFGRASGPLASRAATGGVWMTSPNTHAATKASNLGDLEVLCTYALVGGRVWNDGDGNGTRDGSESGIGSVTLELFDNSALPAPATAPALAAARTDGEGRYLFAAPPNTPIGIRIARASRDTLAGMGYRSYTPQGRGGDRGLDSDLNPTWGFIEFAPAGSSRTSPGSAIPPLWRESEGRAFDIGLRRYQPSGAIGDRVWLDGDGDGVQESGEEGVPNINVTLTSEPGAALLSEVRASMRTDSGGHYYFRNLSPGVYRVSFDVPPAWEATPRDRGGDDSRDSDADASGGHSTGAFTLGESQIDESRDLGLRPRVDLQLAKSGPAAAAFGDTLTYSIVVTNRTGAAATAVVVTDSLPAELALVSASPPFSARARDPLRWDYGGTFTWNLGDLAANASRTITLQARAGEHGAGTPLVWEVANCAAVAMAQTDADPDNDADCATTTLSRIEVELLKTGPDTVIVGDELHYALRYANTSSLVAPGARVSDVLPAGMAFVRWTRNPDGVCTVGSGAASTVLRCPVGDLAPGASGEIAFVARSLPLTNANRPTMTAWPLTNRAYIDHPGVDWPGDLAENNLASAETTVQAPDLAVTLRIDPRPLPVGDAGSLMVSYVNNGAGLARSSVLTVTHDPGPALGAMPAGCTYAAELRVVCALGDLAPGQRGAVALPLRLPATPADPASYPADQLGATAELSTATPERPVQLSDNTASDVVEVVRPNVYVTARGPDGTARLTWGSGIVYDIGYGNLYGAAPALTRAAASSVLTVTLPADTAFLEASAPPALVDGQTLVWELGELAPRAAGGLRVAVRASVPAGAQLRLEAEISTATPGDDPSDNRATVDTIVVRPPETVPAPAGELRLAIHSELDPRHGGADEGDGVYLTPPGATAIAWPAGEVLDFTPRLDRYELEPPGWPLEYRARVTGWALRSIRVDGREAAATAPDSRGVAGCRGAGAPPAGGSVLTGCAYSYVGAGAEGRSVDDFLPAAEALREADMAGQAHVYWTQPPAPPMRPDVYLYTLAPLAPPRLAVAVEVEAWVVNGCPDFLLDPLGSCGAPIELPEPGRVRQLIDGAFDVTLVVPRSVVGPAGLPGR